MGDTNGDGVSDLVAGSPDPFVPGTGRLLDGPTGATLGSYSGPTPGSFFENFDGVAAPALPASRLAPAAIDACLRNSRREVSGIGNLR